MNDSPPDPGTWVAQLEPQPPAGELGPLQLAWLGDAVWELHLRLQHCRLPGRSAALHKAVVAAVRADAQAEQLGRLEPLLSEAEQDLVRLAELLDHLKENAP